MVFLSKLSNHFGGSSRVFIYENCGAAVPFPPTKRLCVQERAIEVFPRNLKARLGDANFDRGTLSNTGSVSGEISLRARFLCSCYSRSAAGRVPDKLISVSPPIPRLGFRAYQRRVGLRSSNGRQRSNPAHLQSQSRSLPGRGSREDRRCSRFAFQS